MESCCALHASSQARWSGGGFRVQRGGSRHVRPRACEAIHQGFRVASVMPSRSLDRPAGAIQRLALPSPPRPW